MNAGKYQHLPRQTDWTSAESTDWTAGEWCKVIFSKESIFWLFETYGKSFAQRRKSVLQSVLCYASRDASWNNSCVRGWLFLFREWVYSLFCQKPWSVIKMSSKRNYFQKYRQKWIIFYVLSSLMEICGMRQNRMKTFKDYNIKVLDVKREKSMILNLFDSLWSIQKASKWTEL